MRILRFAANSNADLGSDPHYGVLNEENSILVLRGDPIYTGLVPTETKIHLDEVRLLAPVLPRSKVVCIGKNYADHAKEMGGEVPAEPIIFLKPNTSVIGPGETINWPAMSDRIDYEGELALVIGRICKDVPKERAHEVIFGYTIANDVTARDLQSRDGQWTRAKGFDTFCPLGPWIETDYNVSDQQIKTSVDGEIKQDSDLSHMIFDIPTIINFVSSVMTLFPGDVILTGTPSGIGPMKAGAKVTVEIEGIGALTNTLSSKAI